MLDFITAHPFLVGWMTFVILTYMYVVLDYAYYRYDVRRRAAKLYEAITEEE